MREYNSNSYITTAQLINDAKELIAVLPPDIDAVAGSARSGLLPATLLSCLLHRPLYSIGREGVILCDGGFRTYQTFPNKKIEKILIVEDTIYSGRTLDKCINRIKVMMPGVQIIKAAVYCVPDNLHKVDYCHAILPPPHYLEWNFFNSTLLDYSVFDFDGIFCEDILPIDDDDGARYIKALENAIPKFYVRVKPIHTIITARLEKYRGVTEAWLAKQGMSCKRLIMGPWPSLRERCRHGVVSGFKAERYAKSGLRLFVESCPIQAREIFDLTKKPVLCPDLGEVLRK